MDAIEGLVKKAELHSYIFDAFSQRGKGDYDIAPLEKEDVKELLDNAKIFLGKAKEYLSGQGIIQ